MNAPSYLSRLREKKQKNMRHTGTDKTDKTNLVSLVSSPLAHKSSFFSDEAKTTLPASKTGKPVTSWAWRIIYQDGTKVEAFFSPAVSRDEALRLNPGAVNAEPIVDQKVTNTRVDIPDDLRGMIQAMGEYWHYSDGDYATAYEGARADPDQWRTLCLEDSKRFGWRVPEAFTQAEIDDAVAEAVAERRAILEHEARLSAERADAITRLATAFYRHVFGVAYETGCCKPRSGSYCVEGLRLKDAYHEAVS